MEITEVDTSTAYASYIVSGTNTQIGVTTLHPYYQYNFTVAAYTVGKGPLSGGLVIRTFQDGKFNHVSFMSMHVRTLYNLRRFLGCIANLINQALQSTK